MSAKRDESTRWGSYSKVDLAEKLLEKSDQSVSSEEPDEINGQTAALLRSYRKRIAILSGTCILLLISTLGFLTAYILKTPTDRECTDRTAIWSPANEAVEYVAMDFDNAFAHDTVYRGVPSVELENAWQDLWYHGALRIPEDKLPLINRTFDMGNGQTLRPWEDGKGGYHAMLEVSHQIHCLNLVRQYTWRDWYKSNQDIVRAPPDMMNSDVAARMHADHCIETLRLAIICHGDTTPALNRLDPSAPHGSRADFGPHHMCRKFDKIQTWLDENAVDEPPEVSWEPYNETIIYDLPDGLD